MDAEDLEGEREQGRGSGTEKFKRHCYWKTTHKQWAPELSPKCGVEQTAAAGHGPGLIGVSPAGLRFVQWKMEALGQPRGLQGHTAAALRELTLPISV